LFSCVIQQVCAHFVLYLLAGVRVGRSSGSVDIQAKKVISDAGITNTFKKLLPADVAKKSSESGRISKLICASLAFFKLSATLWLRRGVVLMRKKTGSVDLTGGGCFYQYQVCHEPFFCSSVIKSKPTWLLPEEVRFEAEK